MSDIKSVYDTVKENYLEYGREINTNRSVVNIDGLKKLHRRILITANRLGKKEPTSTLSGEVAKLHPHASQDDTISMLVRAGILEGLGNHGSDTLVPCPPAASRYTKSGMNKDLVDYFFKLSSYCKMKEGELEGYMEPAFLITPVPACLIVGGAGIGLGGVIAKYPCFSYSSLLEAHFNNDPKLLRGSKNTIIDMDYDGLWKKGVGKITYMLDVYREFSKDDNTNVTVIRGKLGGIVPDVSVFDDYIAEGRVFLRDESSTSLKIVVGRTPNTRAITDDEIYNLCKEISTKTIQYRLMVSLEDKVKLLGIRDWLKLTVKNYTAVFERWKRDSVKYYNNLIEEYTLLPEVGKRVLANMDIKDIASELNTTQAMVERISKKAISMLRKSDYSSRIKDFETKRDKIDRLDPKSEMLYFNDVWEKAVENYYQGDK
ncbi:TPA: hypothetical protein SFZ51_000736 [Campylobacter jejuni]|nr:hypothetical protein [Campylobacter jejuni]HEG8104737.1 hypothetical protein [Campylobacter jejuni]HEG8133625.1 hypothetical protein [Campylobacter jejuni]